MHARFRSSPALLDIVQSLAYSRAIIYMAMSDLRARYKRSVLGPLWMTLGTAIGAVGLSFLWAELMHKDVREFMPTVTAGLILWQFIAGVVGDASALFSRQAALIRNINLPLSIYPTQLLLRHLINLLHSVPVFAAVAWAVGLHPTLNLLLVVPGVVLVTLNLLWLALLVGMLGARFRDLEYLIASALPLLMLLSPVFYRPEFLPFSEVYLWANPISHFIEVIRYPLMGSAPPGFVIWTNLGLLLVGGSVSLWMFDRKHHRIAFWV